jgi:hypothetical protein
LSYEWRFQFLQSSFEEVIVGTVPNDLVFVSVNVINELHLIFEHYFSWHWQVYGDLPFDDDEKLVSYVSQPDNGLVEIIESILQLFANVKDQQVIRCVILFKRLEKFQVLKILLQLP